MVSDVMQLEEPRPVSSMHTCIRTSLCVLVKAEWLTRVPPVSSPDMTHISTPLTGWMLCLMQLVTLPHLTEHVLLHVCLLPTGL